jgi:hypothetical protein
MALIAGYRPVEAVIATPSRQHLLGSATRELSKPCNFTNFFNINSAIAFFYHTDKAKVFCD